MSMHHFPSRPFRPGTVHILPRVHLDPGKGAPVSWCCVAETLQNQRLKGLHEKTKLLPPEKPCPFCILPAPSQTLKGSETSATPSSAGRGETLGSKLDKEPSPSPWQRTSGMSQAGRGEGELALKRVRNFYYLELDHFNYWTEAVFVV